MKPWDELRVPGCGMGNVKIEERKKRKQKQ